MPVLEKTLVSPEEFEEMLGVDHLELVDGEIREKGMGNLSSLVQSRINRRLGVFVEDRKLGEVFDGDAGYRCFLHRPGLVRKPDVSFIRNGRYPNNNPPLGFATIVPDLVVEVISPRDTSFDVQERLNDYLLVQAPAVWIVDPHTRTVHVYHADGTVRRLTAEQELTGDPVLPGFRVRVADLFPPPLPQAPELPPTSPA